MRRRSSRSWRLYNCEPNIFDTVLAVVVTVDVMDFEREVLAAAVERIEPDGFRSRAGRRGRSVATTDPLYRRD